MATTAEEMDMMGVVVDVDGHGNSGGGSAAATEAAATATLFDYAMASTYNTAGTDALVTSADMAPQSTDAYTSTATAISNSTEEEPMEIDSNGHSGNDQREPTAPPSLVVTTASTPVTGPLPATATTTATATTVVPTATVIPTATASAAAGSSPAPGAALFDQQGALESELSMPHDKKTGRPSHPAWEHFVRGDKRNRFHHHAYCKYCTAHGANPAPVRGVSGNMIRHLQKCIYCPEEIVSQLRILCAQKDAVNFNKRHQQHQPVASPTPLQLQQHHSPHHHLQAASVEMSGVGGIIHAHAMAAAAAAAAAETSAMAPSAAKKLKRTIDPNGGNATPGAIRLGARTAADMASVTTGPFMALQMPAEMAAAGRAGGSSGSSGSGMTASTIRAKARGNFAAARHNASVTASLLLQSPTPQPRAQHTSVVNQAALNRLVLKATLSSSLPLDWMSMEEALRLTALPRDAHQVASHVTLPLRTALYNPEIVASLADVTHESQLARLKDDTSHGTGTGTGVTLAVNLWFSKAERTNLLLFSVVNAVGDATAYALVDVGMADVALEDLSSEIKRVLAALSEDGIALIAIVADSLLAYAAAKAAITTSGGGGGDDAHPPIAVLPSFEAFLVNALGVILTISESHTETMGNVIDLVAAFSNTRLRDTLRRECGDADAALVLPCEDKWFSFIDCIDSVRQFEDMIKIIGLRAMIHQSDAAAAAATSSRSTDQDSGKPASAVGDFPTQVLETIQNPHFWETVVSLSELMSPIKETYRLILSHSHGHGHPMAASGGSSSNSASNNSHHTGSGSRSRSSSSVSGGSSSSSSSAVMAFSLSNVFYQLGRMYQQYTSIIADWEENPSASRVVGHVRYLQEQVNKTWKLYDQPLMYLAYTLDYNMLPSLLARNSLAPLQWLSMGKYAKEYFRRWFCMGMGSSTAGSSSSSSSFAANRPGNPRPGSGASTALTEDAASQFLEDVLALKERKYPFDADSVCDLENPRAFYQLISDSNPLMHLFGARVFSFATSVPQLARIVPGKSSITRVATAACAQSLLLPLVQLKLRARTTAKNQSAKDFVALLSHGSQRSGRRPSTGTMSQDAASDDTEMGDVTSDGGTALLLSGTDRAAVRGIWSDRAWRLLARQWKLEWEHEGNVGNVLDTVAGLNASSRLQVVLLTLDQIFKEKLPSRLQQSREEEAVVDV